GQAPSTGLGLAIVDAVATAHGGTVHLDSHPGTTRFTITLPPLGTGELAAQQRS
ncbi:MAG: ATP-binding protein, partial [Streptosporangiaceae bacterium]